MTPKQFIPRAMKGTARSYADNPGRLFHGVLPGEDVAICGTRPGKTSAGWDSFVGRRVTCHKCLKRLALLPKDPTDDPAFIIKTIGCSFILYFACHGSEAGRVDSIWELKVSAREVLAGAKERMTWHIAEMRDLTERLEDKDLVQRLRDEADAAVQAFFDQTVDEIIASGKTGAEASRYPFRLVAGY